MNFLSKLFRKPVEEFLEFEDPVIGALEGSKENGNGLYYTPPLADFGGMGLKFFCFDASGNIGDHQREVYEFLRNNFHQTVRMGIAYLVEGLKSNGCEIQEQSLRLYEIEIYGGNDGLDFVLGWVEPDETVVWRVQFEDRKPFDWGFDD